MMIYFKFWTPKSGLIGGIIAGSIWQAIGFAISSTFETFAVWSVLGLAVAAIRILVDWKRNL